MKRLLVTALATAVLAGLAGCSNQVGVNATITYDPTLYHITVNAVNQYGEALAYFQVTAQWTCANGNQPTESKLTDASGAASFQRRVGCDFYPNASAQSHLTLVLDPGTVSDGPTNASLTVPFFQNSLPPGHAVSELASLVPDPPNVADNRITWCTGPSSSFSCLGDRGTAHAFSKLTLPWLGLLKNRQNAVVGLRLNYAFVSPYLQDSSLLNQCDYQSNPSHSTQAFALLLNGTPSPMPDVVFYGNQMGWWSISSLPAFGAQQEATWYPCKIYYPTSHPHDYSLTIKSIEYVVGSYAWTDPRGVAYQVNSVYTYPINQVVSSGSY